MTAIPIIQPALDRTGQRRCRPGSEERAAQDRDRHHEPPFCVAVRPNSWEMKTPSAPNNTQIMKLTSK